MIKSNNYAKLKPMYPLLIQQFVDDYNLSKGIAVDIGVGPGFMGIEMAKITNMKIIFADINQESLNQAKNNFNSLDLDNDAEYIKTDVEDIIFEDNYADFIMSRGSIWFWKEPEKGLREIQRILKPGGVAVVGGGLGRYLPETMRIRLLESLKNGLKKRNEKRPSLDEFKDLVQKSGLSNYRIMTDGYPGSGKWVEIRK